MKVTMSRDWQGILDAQIELYGRISRAHDNLKKSGLAKLTVGVVEARLEGLEANWAKFEAQHEKLRGAPREVVEAHDYKAQDIPELAEETFLQQKGIFKDLIQTAKAQETATTAKEQTTETVSKERTTLSRIQLSSFSGKYEDWPSFREDRKSVV